MNARLFCKTGQLSGASYNIGGEATIGKSSGNTIQLYPSLVSGKHARIYFDEKAKAYFIEDLGSRNGTKLDGVRVKTKERLGKLHVITFANTFDFIFQFAETPQQRNAPQLPKSQTEDRKTEIGSGFVPLPNVGSPKPIQQPSQEPERKTVFDNNFGLPKFEQQKQTPPQDEPLQRDRTRVSVDFTPAPSFVNAPPSVKPAPLPEVRKQFVLTIDTPAAEFPLKSGSNIVGRENSCDIKLDHPSLSRKHAELIVAGDSVRIKDLGSKNHTYINDQRISTEVELREGMVITFGVLKARLVAKTAA